MVHALNPALSLVQRPGAGSQGWALRGLLLVSEPHPRLLLVIALSPGGEGRQGTIYTIYNYTPSSSPAVAVLVVRVYYLFMIMRYEKITQTIFVKIDMETKLMLLTRCCVVRYIDVLLFRLFKPSP